MLDTIGDLRQPVPALGMSVGQLEVLESVARSSTAPHREMIRGASVADGRRWPGQHGDCAGFVDVAGPVREWRVRFAEEGLVQFAQVREGRGRKKTIPQDKIDEVVDLTLNYRPAGENHRSCRSMATATRVSKSTVQQVWSARGLKPHRVEMFKLSNGPKFEEKLVDVVGLHLNPPH